MEARTTKVLLLKLSISLGFFFSLDYALPLLIRIVYTYYLLNIFATSVMGRNKKKSGNAQSVGSIIIKDRFASKGQHRSADSFVSIAMFTKDSYQYVFD